MPAQEEDFGNPPEDLDLSEFEDYVDSVFGDINFEPSAKTEAQAIDLVPGDHVAVKFAATPRLNIWHHGIFVGRKFDGQVYNEKMVIDNSKKKKQLSLISMLAFSGDNVVYRIDYDGDDDKERLKRARMKAKWALKNSQHFKYQPLGNNCEHFAMWCSTLASMQVNVDLLPHYVSTYHDDKRRAFFFADETCESLQTVASPSRINRL